MAEKRGLQKSTVLAENLPPISVFSDGSIGHYVRYRITSKDRNRFSHWSPICKVIIPSFINDPGTVDVNFAGNSVIATWADTYNRPRYDVFVKWGNAASKVLITADAGSSPATSTVRLQVDDNSNYSIGDEISVDISSQQSIANGDFIVSNVNTVSAKHYVYYHVSGSHNTGSELTITGELSTRYLYHGTPSVHTYSFLKIAGYTSIHVDILVDSIEKVYTDLLLVYDSVKTVIP